MDTARNMIFDQVRTAGRGQVFTPKDFLDAGSRYATDQALSRLAHTGELQRLGRGLYYYPRINTKLGIPVAPDVDKIAQAIGRRTGSRMVPSGAVAANLFGLSTQVPAKFSYLTDGRSRRLQVGNLEIQIKHVTPKELPPGSQTSAMVFQALRHLGREAVDANVIAKFRAALSVNQKRELLQDARYTTGWIANVVQQIVTRVAKKTESKHG
ncbi:MAG: type IV toxin-antitoxin system AbiEi family antitoxin domain-containing protein [Phycisphaerales bacterium]|nr:type IV toxin-antitoxin system AbiEi family antitoxin domain-containing protein [Phycisphaerales bacterium]